jgi:hypothetical protein
MSEFFVELPGQLQPFETPFDTPARPVRRCQFVYLTNRGGARFSGLLPIDYDWSDLGWKLAHYFPMGYTNLYHLEKRYTAHPDLSGNTQFKRDNRYSPRVYYPKGIDRGQREGNLLLVLREPTSSRNPHDIIGAMFVEQRAINMADRYAKQYGRRAVVGLLIADITWH